MFKVCHFSALTYHVAKKNNSLYNKIVILLFLSRTLSDKLQGVDEATRRAQTFPILMCHGKGNLIEFKKKCFRRSLERRGEIMLVYI